MATWHEPFNNNSMEVIYDFESTGTLLHIKFMIPACNWDYLEIGKCLLD